MAGNILEIFVTPGLISTKTVLMAVKLRNPNYVTPQKDANFVKMVPTSYQFPETPQQNCQCPLTGHKRTAA